MYEHEPRYDETAGGGFLMGLLCGAALGAAVGLMFAPKSGPEFRQTLAESKDQWKRKAADYYGQASETVNNAVSRGRDAIGRGREAFDSARETAVDRSQEMFDKARATTNDIGSMNTTGLRT